MFRLGLLRGEIAVVKCRIGHDRLPRDFVEGDVLRRQVRRRSDHQRVGDALRITRGPAHRLHAAERTAHDCGEFVDAEFVDQARVRIDPVFHRHERKIGAVRLAGFRTNRQRPGRAKTRPQIVYANDEKTIGIDRFAGPDHVVPPADIAAIVFVMAGHVMRSVECMTDQNRIGFFRVQRAVGLIGQIVFAQSCATGERQRFGKMRVLRRSDHDIPTKKARPLLLVGPSGSQSAALAEFIGERESIPAPAS